MDHLSKTNKNIAHALGRRGFLLTAGATLLYGAGAHAAPANGGSAPSSAALYPVTILDNVSLTDSVRNRTFLLRAYYPTTTGTYPTIVFSHGFGGDMRSFTNTAQAWAAQGFVVIHPTHSDSVYYPDPARPKGVTAALQQASEGNSAPLSALLEDPFFLSSRLADISFVVARLNAGTGIHSELHKKVLSGKYGMAGHSFGAYTTQVIGGALLATTTRNPPEDLKKRFAATIAISPQGSGRMDLTSTSFSTIKKPFFAITGTLDTGAGGESPEWRLEPYYKCAPGGKFAAVVKDFDHMSFDSDGEGSQALRAMQLDFWRAYLVGTYGPGNKLLATAKSSTSSDTVWLRTR